MAIFKIRSEFVILEPKQNKQQKTSPAQILFFLDKNYITQQKQRDKVRLRQMFSGKTLNLSEMLKFLSYIANLNAFNEKILNYCKTNRYVIKTTSKHTHTCQSTRIIPSKCQATIDTLRFSHQRVNYIRLNMHSKQQTKRI